MSHPAATLVPQLAHNLGQILTWIDKTAAYAEERGFDPDVLLTARLYPDMFPLARQVGAACDTAKLAGARLTGATAPEHADDETTWEQLRARVTDVIGWLDGLDADAWSDASDAVIQFPWYPGKALSGDSYLLQFAVPNFYFHLSMTYALLRHGGVPLGKADYLGSMDWYDV